MVDIKNLMLQVWRKNSQVPPKIVQGREETMKFERLLEQLEYDEGVVREIYLDHLGYATFGIGHLVKEDDPEWGAPVGTKVSYQRVQDCFRQDVDVAIKECAILYREDYFEDFPGEVQEILVNMMFNLGRPRLSKFKKMKAALEKGDWKEAAKEGRDSKWYKQVTKRAERLMTRLENIS